MNNNSLVLCIGIALIVVSFVLVLAKAIVDVSPYIIVGVALMLGSTLNEILGNH